MLLFVVVLDIFF